MIISIINKNKNSFKSSYLKRKCSFVINGRANSNSKPKLNKEKFKEKNLTQKEKEKNLTQKEKEKYVT